MHLAFSARQVRGSRCQVTLGDLPWPDGRGPSLVVAVRRTQVIGRMFLAPDLAQDLFHEQEPL
jgi:hypothetical protein